MGSVRPFTFVKRPCSRFAERRIFTGSSEGRKGFVFFSAGACSAGLERRLDLSLRRSDKKYPLAFRPSCENSERFRETTLFLFCGAQNFHRKFGRSEGVCIFFQLVRAQQVWNDDST